MDLFVTVLLCAVGCAVGGWLIGKGLNAVLLEAGKRG